MPSYQLGPPRTNKDKLAVRGKYEAEHMILFTVMTMISFATQHFIQSLF